jgi:putative transcription factor
LIILFFDSDNAGTNKQHAPTKNTAKLDRETEELRHKSVDNNVARCIQQGRQAKGLSQKDLATKINEKQQIVNDYEAGRYDRDHFMKFRQSSTMSNN